MSTGPAGGNAETSPTFVGSSADGAKVYFMTPERLTADDTDNSLDVYEHAGGTTTRVSTGPAGGNGAMDAVAVRSGVAADGSGVIIATREALTTNDADLELDVYERSGTTTRLLSGEGNPPQTTITAGPADGATIAGRSARFEFSANEAATFQCRVDGAAFAPCTSPFSTGDLSDGPHRFEVRATDAFGNLETGVAGRGFTVPASTPPGGGGTPPGGGGPPGGGPGPGAATLTITSRRLRLDRKRRIAVGLRCAGPAGSRCRGTLAIRTRSRLRTSRGRRIVKLATRRFDLRAGSRTTLKLKLPTANRRLIRRLRRVPVTVRASMPVAGGKPVVVSRRVTLRFR